MFTVIVEDREKLMKKLRDNNIESAQVHYRNDSYSICGGRVIQFPNMDAIKCKYLILPLHTKMNELDVDKVSGVIKSGW